jgi:cohesin complex subunit SCC1
MLYFVLQAAQKFYSLLVLKKFQMLDIDQEQPFAEIVCSRGEAFDENKAL